MNNGNATRGADGLAIGWKMRRESWSDDMDMRMVERTYMYVTVETHLG